MLALKDVFAVMLIHSENLYFIEGFTYLMYILRFESIGIRVKRVKARAICMLLNPAISCDSEETISRAVLTIK